MAEIDSRLEEINRRFDSIERRLDILESALSSAEKRSYSIVPEQPSTADRQAAAEMIDDEEKGLESQIGRFGLAWLGNIVLLIGIAVLAQYAMNMGQSFLSVVIGISAAGSLFYVSDYLKKSNEHLSFMFRMNAMILLYYITVRLHFFSASPVIASKWLVIALLLIIVFFQSYQAIRNQSQAYAGLSVIFAVGTAIAGESTHFMLPIVTLTAAVSVYYYIRFGWKTLLLTTVLVSYFSLFLWIFGNPVMGHPMQIISDNHYGFIYLFAIGACYSTVLLFRTNEGSTDDFLAFLTIINGILFSMVLLLISVRFFSNSYVALFSVLSACCIIYSAILHTRSDWNFASAFYSLYGFMAMSIALYGPFGFPKVYLLLSFQSLVVVSIALWYRNRLIVIMNSLLFLFIYAVYFFTSRSVDGVNISFALIALVSARIINWKKSRLQIKTEFIRNLYLSEGFFMVLFALFHAVPKQFVTLSWTMAALIYFILSFVLRNVKYRYMALGTMVCAAFYLFLVDLAHIEIIYRVLALMFLAAISIGISIYYSQRIKKSGN